jgi:polyvinyl alcohol dehydrogenase (cytochrome)
MLWFLGFSEIRDTSSFEGIPTSKATTEFKETIHMSIQNRSLPVTALISVVLLVSALCAQTQSHSSRSGHWQIAGQNLNNTWSQPAEHSISRTNVKKLKPKWVFTTGGDVSATPTLAGDAVYFPDWAGNLFAVNRDSGHLIWSHKISDYDGVAGAVSRVSPAVDHDQLIWGHSQFQRGAQWRERDRSRSGNGSIPVV